MGNRLIGEEYKREIGERVVQHRDEFVRFFSNRFIESLATLFNYNIELPFDRNLLEYALRNGYGVVFGKNAYGQDTILGYVISNMSSGALNNNVDTLFKKRLYKKSDIKFIIPDWLIPQGDMREIYYYDKALTGDFVVIWNKPVELTNDFEIIKHYTNSLAEIVASRYSLVIQAKVQTIFVGEVGDETLNQAISALYNGQPFTTFDNFFDPERDIINYDNGNIASNLDELKTEYQNIISELNAIFGTNILAVDKESGVTDSEANGNLSYVNNNLAIWLKSRQAALDLYNTRFGTDYHVTMSDAKQGLLTEQDSDTGVLENEDDNPTD